jgi:cation transport ATPase
MSEPVTPPRNATTDPTPRELTAGRVATGLVALEALALAGIALFYLYELAIGEGTDPMIVIMSVVTMVVFVIGFSYTAKGLWQRHPRAQAPAIAANFLLVALGIAMFQFAPGWLAALVLVVAAATVIGTFLMGRLEGRPTPP